MRLKALRIMSVDSATSPLARFGSGCRVDSSGRRRLILALGASLALTACGRKGSLDLPPVEPVLGDEPASDDEAASDDVSGDDVQ